MSDRVPLYVFGAGGHGKVVAAAALASRCFDLRGFLDDDVQRHGQTILGLAVVGGVEAVNESRGRIRVALGVGSNRARLDLLGRLLEGRHSVVSVVHPSAVVASGASVGEGTYVGPLAVIHADTRVGRACIVNSGAVVEHDNVLEEGVHVSPNAAVGGDVTIEMGAHVGLGAVILPNLVVGAWAVVGAGAVVTSRVPPGATVVGIPARPLHQ